jgi:ATP-dependent Zn protease
LKNDYRGSIVITSNQEVISNLNLNINFIEDNVTYVKINSTKINVINQTKSSPYQIQPEKKSGFIKVIIILAIIILIVYFIFKRKIKKSESFEEHFYKSRKD